MGAGCCDNKAFGEPCADCAFDTSDVADQAVAMESGGERLMTFDQEVPAAAANALDFGSRVAAASPGGSHLWHGSLAAEVYRRSGQPYGMLGELLDSAQLVDPYAGDNLASEGIPGASPGAEGPPAVPLGPVVITDGGYEMQKAAAEWFGSVWNSLTGDSGEPPNLSTAEKGKCCCCLEEFKLTYAGSTSVQVPATKGVGNMFTLRVTTSWKPALKYKPCRMNWMEYPQTHTDGRGGSYAPSPYTAASDGEAVTPQKLPMDAWTNASDVWSEHPMFDSDLDEGGSDVSMNEALKGDGSTCPPRKTGLIVDIPAKASQGLMILYGAIQLFTGCPPQAEVKTGAEVVPGCQNVEILWWWAGSKTGPDVQSALWMSEGHDSDTGSDAPRDAPDAKGYNPPPTSEGGPEFPPRGGR